MQSLSTEDLKRSAASAMFWRVASFTALLTAFFFLRRLSDGAQLEVLYAAAVALAMLSGSVSWVITVATLATGLVLLNVVQSPVPDSVQQYQSTLNERLEALFAIVIVATMALLVLRLKTRARLALQRAVAAETEFRDKLHLLQVASRMSRVGGWTVDMAGRKVRWSDETARIHGMPEGFSPSFEDAVGYYAPQCQDRICEVFEDCAAHGTPFNEELQIITRGEELLWVQAAGHAVYAPDGKVLAVQGAFQDINARKMDQLRVIRLSRVHAVLSQTNAAMVGLQDRQQLFDTACRIAVESGGMRASWIGLLVGDSGKVLPVARAGTLDHYLESIRVSQLVEAEGLGPFGRAVRENQCVVCNDTAHDPSFAPWRERALALGFHSVAVFPLRMSGRVAGAIVFYADVVDFFNAEEISLFGDLADNISFASYNIAQEATLRDSEALVRMASKISRLGAWEVFLPECSVAWSDDLCRMADIPGGVPLDWKQALGFVDPPYWDSVKAAFRSCMTDGSAFDLEAHCTTVKGRPIWVRLIGEAVRDGAGRIVRVHGACQDISNHKQIEQEARKLAERLTNTLESITDAFFTVDQSWHIDYLNKEGARLLLRLPEQIVGLNIWEAFPNSEGSPFKRQCLRAMEHGVPLALEDFFTESKALFEIRIYPSKEGLAIHFRNITAKRKTDSQLHLLETAVARLNDIILITEAAPIDEPGPRIVFVNDAFERHTGYTRSEVLGKSPRFLQGPSTSRMELDRIRTALAQWKPVRAELLNYKKTGEPIWLELDLVPLANATGRFTHWVSVERDITERRTLEEHVRHSQHLDAVGQLTGGMAHDFNNLLTVIMGNAEMLVDELPPNHALRDLAQMIGDAAQRGAELTQRMLAFAQRQPLEPRPVDINLLVAGMNGLLRRSLGAHIEIEFVRRAGLWTALVDPAQLESSLLNLCLNSRDAMGQGGRLTIETHNVHIDRDYADRQVEVVPGQYVMLAVSDTGTGIAPELLSRVLEPFFTTKEQGKGTGLGLSMVYGFVKQSHGHMAIYSEPGQGTTVKMYLPRVQAAAQLPDKAQAQAQSEPCTGTGTILLVEDDELVLQYAASQLASLGYQVIEAVDGPSALRIIEQDVGHSIKLLFTDVVMPGGINGRVLADAVRALRPEMPVLFTSGYTENAIVHHDRLDVGAQFLGKPYRRAELARRVAEILIRS